VVAVQRQSHPIDIIIIKYFGKEAVNWMVLDLLKVTALDEGQGLKKLCLHLCTFGTYFIYYQLI
jgi:hypothetical protein